MAQPPEAEVSAPELVAQSHNAAVEETRRRGAELRALG